MKKEIIKIKDKEQLEEIIKQEIKENGNECNLNHLDISNITDLSYIFCNSKFNGDISNWDTSNVKDMEKMFYQSKFNGDISCWDVNSVENMSNVFEDSVFNLDISNWDVSNVKDMSWMFFESKFEGDISNWSTSNVTDMSYMFANCEFNRDINQWDVSKVEEAEFFLGTQFNRNIENLQFINCKNFKNLLSITNKNKPTWYSDNEEDMLNHFENVKISKKELEILKGKNSNKLTSKEKFKI